MKCTLTQTKQQRIRQLTSQNKQLEQQLQQLLKQSMETATDIKQLIKQQKCIETQLQVQRMRQSLLMTSLCQFQNEKGKIEEEMRFVMGNFQGLANQNRMLGIQMYEKRKKKEQMDAMLSRLKAELKTYHNMNNTQVMKNSESLKKTNQCLERTLAVLTNKLQSHKKYLSILQKKQQKQQEQANNIQNKSGNKAKSTANLKTKTYYLYQKNEKLEQSKLNCQGQQERKKEKDLERKKIKQYDDLTRKKNQMLNNKGKK